MPKTKHPVADYITNEQYQTMLKTEKYPVFRLVYRVMFGFMLRVSEVVGQSQADANQITQTRKRSEALIYNIKTDPKLLEEYKRDHKGQEPRIGKRSWAGKLPGIRMIDIDAVKPAEVGLEAAHTLRVYRKMGKFEIMPFNDLELYNDIMQYFKKQQEVVNIYNTCFKSLNDIFPEAEIPLLPPMKKESRLFPLLRQQVLERMNEYGSTVGGMTKIHPHALRRGGGIHMRAQGKLDIEELQAVYSHSNLSQTLAYIGIDKKTAFNKFAKAQGGTKA